MTRGPTPARLAALAVLRAVRAGALADRALLAESRPLPVRDRAWAHELVFGTLRLRGRLDHLIAAKSKRPLDAVHPDILDVLRLGAYQLEAMASVPPYAAISESVELAKRAGQGRAAGFVNAVLQGLHRGRAGITFPRLEEDALAHLSTWGSHPPWLVERWIARFGVEQTAELVAVNNRRPSLYMRPVGVAAERAAERWREAGIETEPVDFAPDSVRLDETERLRDALAAVPSIVQDPAAALVVRVSAPRTGDVVLDLCASPGGKALGLAGGTAEGERPRLVVAADLTFGRVARLRENVARLDAQQAGMASVSIAVSDARRPAFRKASASLVLIDAPCTGTGTLRRHPDGRWRIGPEDLAALAMLQRELLDAAAEIVAPDGVLVYATCSIEPEENGQQVEAFLKRHEEFAEEPVTGVDAHALDEAGRLSVLPQTFGVDGSFAARLRRRV